jgi:hypothetical protein
VPYRFITIFRKRREPVGIRASAPDFASRLIN